MTASTTYPRPDFERQPLCWASLDGPWDFIFDDADAGLSQSWPRTGLPAQAGAHQKRRITVPYAFQTPASGIGLHEAHEVVWYERAVSDVRTADDRARGHRLLLRFGAVDYEATVWVDGRLVGAHRGGHVPFDLDVTEALGRDDPQNRGTAPAPARLTVRVRDSPYDLGQPRGKQYWGPVSTYIFYTPSTGIWLSVWLESVPAMRLGAGSEGTVLRSDDIGGGELHARVAVVGRPAGAKCHVKIAASLAGVAVGSAAQELSRDKDIASLDVDMKVASLDVDMKVASREGLDLEPLAWHDNGVALWAPEHPVLYDLILYLYDGSGKVVDEVRTTTGMRSVSWQAGDGTFRLNGRPYFQALVLDQGYWPETFMTPPSPDALAADIEMAKKMGFNGCRKHQKVEDPRFLWYADRLGFLVWGEMANAYEFNSGFVDRFNQEWTEAIRRDINHPCIVAWTPVNESWGYTSLKDNIEQRNHIRSLYYIAKTLDPSRPINDNCGWEHVCTDLTTYHDYADSTELAVTCSEMEGGILGPKGGHDMFSRPIWFGSRLLDAGAQHTPGAPTICTEFGGVNIAPAADQSAGERDWGYTTADDPTDLLKRVESLVMAIVKGGHSCGFVYTQLSDIEQEVNGLYSYDRREKIPADQVKAIMDGAQKYYYEKVAPH